MNSIELPSGLSVMSHTNKRVPQPIDYKKAIDAAQVLQDMQNANGIIQPSADVRINTSDPVALFFHGDQHIGNVDTNYAELYRQNQTIKSMKNAFVSYTGDVCDHMFWTREAGQVETLTDPMAGDVAAGMMRELDEAGKVVSYLFGNHDSFETNFLRTFMPDFKFPVIGPNNGDIDLTVGQQTYQILNVHKISMGNSTMSPLLACQRAIEYMNGDADIVARGHTHRKAIAQYNLGVDRHKKLRTLIETGTFKPNESWQRGQGNLRTSQFDYGGAGVILYPDKNKVMPFYEFDQGVEMLNGLNGLKSVLSATTSKILSGK